MTEKTSKASYIPNHNPICPAERGISMKIMKRFLSTMLAVLTLFTAMSLQPIQAARPGITINGRAYSVNQDFNDTNTRDASLRGHLGIDICRGRNSYVRAPFGGTVAHSGNVGGANGNVVTIRHNINGTTFYSFQAHLSSRTVNTGDHVRAGDIIGRQGSHTHLSFFQVLPGHSRWNDMPGYFRNASNARVSFSAPSGHVDFRGFRFYEPRRVIASGGIWGTSTTTPPSQTPRINSIHTNRTVNGVTTMTTADRLDIRAELSGPADRAYIVFTDTGQRIRMNASNQNRTFRLYGNQLRAGNNRVIRIEVVQNNRVVYSRNFTVTVTQPGNNSNGRITNVHPRHEGGSLWGFQIDTSGSVGHTTLTFNGNNTVFRPWRNGASFFLNGNQMAAGNRTATVRLYCPQGRHIDTRTVSFTVR
ncbi:MAG: M23 family metallopeptidase [Defluviitaleaceae bacterium]|nr:M23 family metallopeptidase [Defluviitaleaceae bacterium]